MKIGFIGTGVMGSAIMEGLIDKHVAEPSEIIGADVFEPSRERVKSQYGIRVTADNKEAVKDSEVIVLAAKPEFVGGIIDEVREVVTEDQIFISLAPGITLDYMGEHFAKPVKTVRTIPNVAARVGAAMTGACMNEYLDKKDQEKAEYVLSSFGRVEFVPEKLIDSITAVSSASPAYISMVIEAMADAGVIGGIPRKQAYVFAAQAVYGTAKLILDTEKHPGEVKDMVCSPGGITVEGVRVLEEQGVRGAFIDALKTCMDITTERKR